MNGALNMNMMLQYEPHSMDNNYSLLNQIHSPNGKMLLDHFTLYNY